MFYIFLTPKKKVYKIQFFGLQINSVSCFYFKTGFVIEKRKCIEHAGSIVYIYDCLLEWDKWATARGCDPTDHACSNLFAFSVTKPIIKK